MRLFFNIIDAAKWYGRRPWHVLFGHAPACVQDFKTETAWLKYLDTPIYHECCDCGLII